MRYMENGKLWIHVKTSVYETMLGLIIGTVGGVLVAILLWASPRLSKVLDPFLVVLNSLPKVALGPIIIIWVRFRHTCYNRNGNCNLINCNNIRNAKWVFKNR